ncbi:MAG: hypothetical protein M3443_01305 [Actinomycetota bacterium]|nr:hypothetical protein [Actinomycetota bacterium]MDQ3576251.1 hypothetical protein [Actinomycetota bacterium]
MTGDRPSGPLLGPLDPFCWLLIVPMAAVAVVFFASDAAVIGIAVIVFILVVVLFDCWANRHRAKGRDRGGPPSRAPQQARRR